MAHSPLTNVVIGASSYNFTYGRPCPISEVTVHHMAGVMTAEQCGGLWQNPNRGGSSNYGIGNDGRIGAYVEEENTSWCNSNWDSNCRAVTIETSNCSTGGDWPVSDAAYESLVRLVADIAKRNGLGKLVPGKNLTWHSMYTSTACPGPYLLARIQNIADRANEINNPSLSWRAMDNPRKMRILAGGRLVKVKTGEVVKQYPEETDVDLTQKCDFNGATYLRSQYSAEHNVDNGFNLKDLKEIPAPAPEPTPEPTPTPTPEPTPEPQPEPEDDTPNWFIRFIKALGEFFINLFKGKE